MTCDKDFEGAGRGAVALENIYVGETALEIPESFIISEAVLIDSKMVIPIFNLYVCKVQPIICHYSFNFAVESI